MNEPEKKPKVQSESAGDGTNVKPFPDFIATGPGGGGAGAFAAPSEPPHNAPRQAPPHVVTELPRRKSGGGGWAFLFAVVALSAAAASMAAPSLRPLVAQELTGRFGQQRWIAVLTGTADTRAPSVVELDLKQFDQRLDALAKTLTTGNPGVPVDGATLARFADAAGATQRVSELETTIAALKAQNSEQDSLLHERVGKIDATLSELGQRTAALESEAASLDKQIRAADGKSDKVTEIAQTADTAAKELATSLGSAMQKVTAGETAIADLKTQLAELKVQAQKIGDGVAAQVHKAVEPLTGTLDAVKTDLAAAVGGLAGLTGQITKMEDAGALQDGRIETLTTQATELGGKLGSVADQLGKLSTQMAKVEEQLAKPSAATTSMLLGLVNRLRIAVDEGEPFAAEVAAIAALAHGDSQFAAPVKALTPLAPRGVPSAGMLRREFNNAARRVLDAEDAAQPTWYERQVSSLQWYLGWTKETPHVPVTESARPALSQAATAINNGQFGEAIAALQVLIGPGQEHVQPWIVGARARIAADDAVKGLGNATLARLKP